MQAIKCELCGSGNLIKKGSLYICEHCGTKYTVEEARQLLGTVRIDKSDVRENNKILARRAFNNHDYPQAQKYYDNWLSEDPNNWEPYFFSALCRTAQNNDFQNEENCIRVIQQTIPVTIDLIADYSDDPQEQQHILIMVLNGIRSYVNGGSNIFCDRDYVYNDIRPSFAWRHATIIKYLSLFDTFKKCTQDAFPYAQQILDTANKYCQEFTKRNWKHVGLGQLWKMR